MRFEFEHSSSKNRSPSRGAPNKELRILENGSNDFKEIVNNLFTLLIYQNCIGGVFRKIMIRPLAAVICQVCMGKNDSCYFKIMSKLFHEIQGIIFYSCEMLILPMLVSVKI
jgi:sulfatase maturation enzyme AslB (radical SAM superfamily)